MSPIIPMKQLTTFVFNFGVPEKKSVRSLVWKLLLNLLPADRSKWWDHYSRHMHGLVAESV